MATTITLNGTSYSVPGVSDSYGTSLSNYLIALSTGVLSKAGGTFTLTGEANFGATYGLKSAYYKSQATNPGSTGILRLGNNESIVWRNQANNANLALTAYTTDRLQYGGVDVPTISSTDTLTNKTMSGASNTFSSIGYSSLSLTGSLLNADISASAAIALSKIAGGTTGYIPFASSATALSNDSNLFWNNTDKRFCINNVNGGYPLTVTGAASSSLAHEIRLGSGSTVGGLHITDNAGSTEYGFLTATSSAINIGTSKASSSLNLQTGGSTRATIDSSGNVGVGTTPGSLLHIASSTANSSFRIQVSATGEGGEIAFNSADGSVGSESASASSKVLGDISFSGYSGASRSGALIRAQQNGSYTSNSVPTDLYFYTGDGTNAIAERMRLSSTGNLCVGTYTAPLSSAVKTLTVNAPAASDGAVEIATNGTLMATFRAGTGVTAQIGSNSGEFQVKAGGTNPLTLYTNSVERARANEYGFGVGLTPTSRNNTSLHVKDGIGFPATQVPSSDANTLDDYEEGTFSPSVTSTSGTITTVGAVSGQYTKIGNIVTINMSITITTAGTGSGSLKVSNLPFTCTSTSHAGSGREMISTGKVLSVYVDASTTNCYIAFYDSTYPGASGNTVIVTLTYRV